MVIITDEMYDEMQHEASEYRRLLVVCREQIICEMDRADRAERTIQALRTALRKLVEEFNPDISQKVTQSADTKVAALIHWQEWELIQQIQREAEYQPC